MITYLYDALTRHQVYIEGIKAGQAKGLNTALSRIDQDIRERLSGLKYNSLDQMTKSELQTLVQTIRQSQYNIYNEYLDDLLKFLADFMKQDRKMILALFGLVVPDIAREVPSEAVSWSRIQNDPVPASGVLIAAMLTAFTGMATEQVIRNVVAGYANKYTPAQVVAQISGTKAANYKDGVLNRVFNGGKGTINTVIQHVTASGQEIIQNTVFEKYVWVSTLDNKTTAICIARAGNVYFVGKGPVPPAHYGCRSKTVPVTDGEEVPEESFGVWAKRQPVAVLKDMFSTAKADEITSADTKASDIVFGDVKPITLEQFAAKRDFIIGDKE